jgi:hypothetical protein
LLASIFIIVVSAVLFVYWFRYTCLLILSTQSTRNYARQVAAANQMNFLETRSQLLEEEVPAALETLQSSLDRDYRLVTNLLKHAATYNVSGTSIEERILVIDYRIMAIWYSLVHTFSQPMARRALIEQASIVNHLANSMGERVAVTSRV